MGSRYVLLVAVFVVAVLVWVMAPWRGEERNQDGIAAAQPDQSGVVRSSDVALELQPPEATRAQRSEPQAAEAAEAANKLDAQTDPSGSPEAAGILRELERFKDFPSHQHATFLLLSSIKVIQKAKGAWVGPDEQGRVPNPPDVGRDDVKGLSTRDGAVYFFPEEFPEYWDLEKLSSGSRVPNELASRIEARAQEALSLLGSRTPENKDG